MHGYRLTGEENVQKAKLEGLQLNSLVILLAVSKPVGFGSFLGAVESLPFVRCFRRKIYVEKLVRLRTEIPSKHVFE